MTPSSTGSGRRESWLFLGSSLVLIVAVLIGLAREQRWGQPVASFQLISRDATGLRAGQQVRISGIPVGVVHRLHLHNDARVVVEVQVASRYASLIGPASVATQAQEGLVGDHYLQISPDPQLNASGSRPKQLNIAYEQPLALAPLLQQLVQTQKELQATLRNTTSLTAKDIPQTLTQARRSLDRMSNLATTLQREAISTAPDLRSTLRQLNRTGSNAEQTSTQAQQFLQTSQPAIIRTLEEIQKLTRTSQQLLQGLLFLTGSEAPRSTPSQP